MRDLVVMRAAARSFDDWLLRPAPSKRLATLRILVGGFVLVYVVANVGEFERLAARPSTVFEPVGVLGLLDEPLSARTVWLLFALLVVSGAGFMSGTFFRLSGPVFAVSTLVWASYHSSWGQMLHFEHLFTLHVLVLAWSPAAEAWSIDSRRSRRGESDEINESVRFGWPVQIMAIMTAVTYVIAGIAKVRTSGLEWIDGSTLGNHIAYSATRIDLLGGIEPPLASLVVGRSWLIAPMATVALLIELSAPLALFRRLRWPWVICALLFHAATAATMMVWFPYQGLGFAMLPFFAVERLRSLPTTRRLA